MNITEDLKSTLNKTLEIAIGIEKISSMINPQKAHTDGKDLINTIYKDSQILSNQAKDGSRAIIKKSVNNITKMPMMKSIQKGDLKDINIQKRFSLSIKNINQRVKMSKAGQKTVRQALNDELLSFTKSVDKNISSRADTPKLKSLPFISFTTGKLDKPILLPNFPEYLEYKGSNYLKTKYSDELINRFDKATTNIKKFNEEFDTKASNYLKAADDRIKKNNIFSKPSNSNLVESTHASINKRSMVINDLISDLNSNINNEKYNSPSVSSEFLSIQGFTATKKNENKKLLDIINKIDLERPKILKQKVKLIQNDHEKYKNSLHSLKKFQDFRNNVESNRRKLQSINYRQGVAYMNIIEEFRKQKHKPSVGELEILRVWKEMVECGWVIAKGDLEEILLHIINKGVNNISSDSLLEKFSQAIPA